jgi:hypothetical protein
MNIDAEVAEQLNVSVGTRVQYMDQAGIDDDLTSIRLLETGPNTGVFRSESQLLVMPDSGFSLPDDDLSVWSTLFGFAIPDDSINDRTHRARVSGGLQVRREFGPNTPESQIIHRPIFVRDPDYRRIAHVRVRVYNEPFEDAGYTDSSGQFGGAGDGIFSFEDVNGNGTHEPLDPAGNVFERSERFIDVSNSSRDLGLGHAGASSDGRGPVFKMSLIEAEMARASAIWTAAGIDIQFEDILAIDAPMIPGTNATVIDDAGVFNATNGPAIGDELLAMQAIADATPSRVEVIYCGYLLSAAGYARIPANHGQSRPVPLGENTYLFISSDSSSLQSVIAHELGHAFTNGDDFPTQSYIIYPGGDGGIETASPASSRRRLQRTTEIHARQIRLEGNFNMPGNRILVAP